MRGQVWIETVLYTLIGLALIGLVLGYAYPKISAAQEKVVIKQTIDSLKELDKVITDVTEKGPGNKRSYEFGFKSGRMIINSSSEEIDFIIDGLKSIYSEPGIEIQDGPIKFKSFEGERSNGVYIRLSYKLYVNITYSNEENDRVFTPSATQYLFFLTNEGSGASGLSEISFEESSGKQSQIA